ncbi:MAG: ComEC/Rec2 family competence protein [Candidatus Omnitrophica bacterium]|nr:ComEC/Rec2 family competence protein [Candidatus Omnitrophota bacterium]
MRYPLVLPFCLFLSGAVAAGVRECRILYSWGCSLWLIVPFIFLILTFSIPREKTFYSIACVLFFALGCLRYSSSIYPGGDDIAHYALPNAEDGKALIYGTVVSDPEIMTGNRSGDEGYCRFELEARNILVEGKDYTISGKALVHIRGVSKCPEIGDNAVIGGELTEPFGARNPHVYDRRTALAREGITAILYSKEHDLYRVTGLTRNIAYSVQRSVYGIRRRARTILAKYLSGTDLALVESVTLGYRANIPDSVNDMFMKSGTMHILAVSGMQVAMVGAMVLWAAGALGVSVAAGCYSGIILIVLYSIFTGAEPSVVRAAIMGSIFLMNRAKGREVDILNIFALTAFICVFLSPGVIYQAGFVLSYLAVGALVFLTPLSDSFLRVPGIRRGETVLQKIKREGMKFFSLSVAIWVGMAPVIAGYFNLMTPGGVLANFPGVPFLSIGMAGGFCLLVTGPFSGMSYISGIIAAILSGTVKAFLGIMGAVNDIPLMSIRVNSPGITMILLYYLVVAGCVALFNKKRSCANIFLVLALVIPCSLIWNESAQGCRERFRVTFFDVGEADATLFECPRGGTMLVDGGTGGLNPRKGVDCGRRIIAPYLWNNNIRRIDCVIFTHEHEDHLGGLFYIIENFEIGKVIGNVKREDGDSPLLEKLFTTLDEKGIKYENVYRGDRITGLPGLEISVLNPPSGTVSGDTNDNSLVLRVVTGEGNAIFMAGDASTRALVELLGSRYDLRSEIFKYPHHSATPIDDVIFEQLIHKKVKPQNILVSTKSNKSKLKGFLIKKPPEEKVLITSELGVIVFEETGSKLKIIK